MIYCLKRVIQSGSNLRNRRLWRKYYLSSHKGVVFRRKFRKQCRVHLCRIGRKHLHRPSRINRKQSGSGWSLYFMRWIDGGNHRTIPDASGSWDIFRNGKICQHPIHCIKHHQYLQQCGHLLVSGEKSSGRFRCYRLIRVENHLRERKTTRGRICFQKSR